ncbi:hypothetical protein VDG1235_1803 [Verrucomicrobiia bacterium DG1235]|nr:hypothetical protein VDG1235_1803 [Verrucomicrobiae bacterium DG1235]
MKTPLKLLAIPTLIALAISTTPSPISAADRSAPSPAGHWEGSITLPGTTLQMRLDLEDTDAELSGTIDIPAQGMRGYQLVDVQASPEHLSFALPNIPGDPKFHGSLFGDGNSIKGKLSQSGQSFDFEIKRKEKQKIEGETPSHGIPGEGIAGAWQGSLRPGAFELRLLFKLSTENGTHSGTLSSIDQNAHDIPISHIEINESTLLIQIEKIGTRFEGSLSEDGSKVTGNWIQGNSKMPLTILRLEKEPELARPQEPKKPYPYNEEEITFENAAASITLSGTFTFPSSPGPHPTVVLISGSGPQDRDESIMGHRPFLVLADHLTRSGIAVLRYDDRGYNKSTGDFKTATTSDFTTDTLSALAYLKTRSEVDTQQIGLIGHSEGGLIAPQAAVATEDVSFIVLLAGVGVPMKELLTRQSQDMMRLAGASEEMRSFQAGLQKRIFDTVTNSTDHHDLESQIKELFAEATSGFTQEERDTFGLNPGQIDNQIQMVTTPWFRQLLSIDPRPTLQKVECPVLAINGAKDVQVASGENLAAIDSALKSGGNTNITTKEFPNLNHLFQTAESGATSEYGTIEETFNPKALTVVSHWIRKTTGLE